MSDNKCELCGEPMPPGESMFAYHGYSGPCPKPPKAPPKRPEGSNADEWALFLSETSPQYAAVQIAEAIESAKQLKGAGLGSYVSKAVYDGKRELTPDEVARLKRAHRGATLQDRLRALNEATQGFAEPGTVSLPLESADALDAMESALRALIADSDDTDDGIIPAPSAATLAQARQAIAKLEGK